MLEFPDLEIGEQDMVIGLHASQRQTGADTGHRTTVDGQNRPAAPGRLHQTRHAAADARDAGHFGETLPIKPDGHLVGHLRGA